MFGDIEVWDSGDITCRSGCSSRFENFEIYGNSKYVMMGSNWIREILLFFTGRGYKTKSTLNLGKKMLHHSIKTNICALSWLESCPEQNNVAGMFVRLPFSTEF
uniref:Ovule protein n=1 Tax=Elaeophora elaphi TaxID=1147741 RepID=A0A0R3RVU6_9BILA